MVLLSICQNSNSVNVTLKFLAKRDYPRDPGSLIVRIESARGLSNEKKEQLQQMLDQESLNQAGMERVFHITQVNRHCFSCEKKSQKERKKNEN